jgi:hypothetical protein
VHYDFSAGNRGTVLLAFALAFIFACSSGSLRMKAPEETELTMAKIITGRIRQRLHRN